MAGLCINSSLEEITKRLKEKTDYSEEDVIDFSKEIKEIVDSYNVFCNKVSRAMIHYGYAEENFQDLQFYLDNSVFKCIDELV